mmetsp:Transcript_57896/g.135345  ORF Transcript_57896/g.135345 Transcript_57896/m.135345 type:complete len:203 (-) Transcript_57896:2392-3000(-)
MVPPYQPVVQFLETSYFEQQLLLQLPQLQQKQCLHRGEQHCLQHSHDRMVAALESRLPGTGYTDVGHLIVVAVAAACSAAVAAACTAVTVVPAVAARTLAVRVLAAFAAFAAAAAAAEARLAALLPLLQPVVPAFPSALLPLLVSGPQLLCARLPMHLFALLPREASGFVRLPSCHGSVQSSFDTTSHAHSAGWKLLHTSSA